MIYKCSKPIAILLAVYNGEKYMKVQIDSIINQTNRDWALYIRDDASTDLTREIIADYCLKYDNIIAVKDSLGNLGCFENFRQLLRVVDADYYMLSDADDYWLTEKVQVSYDFIRGKEKQYPQIPIMVHTDKSIADSELNIRHASDWISGHYNPDSISDFKYAPRYIVGGATSTINHLAKICSIEPPLFSISHDGWMTLQTARYGKIFAIHQSLLVYRRHGNNTTGANPSHQTLSNQLKRLINIKETIKWHMEFASQLEQIGYGGKLKYFYYRIVVFMKLLWCKLTIR